MCIIYTSFSYLHCDYAEQLCCFCLGWYNCRFVPWFYKHLSIFLTFDGNIILLIRFSAWNPLFLSFVSHLFLYWNTHLTLSNRLTNSVLEVITQFCSILFFHKFYFCWNYINNHSSFYTNVSNARIVVMFLKLLIEIAFFFTYLSYIFIHFTFMLLYLFDFFLNYFLIHINFSFIHLSTFLLYKLSFY